MLLTTGIVAENVTAGTDELLEDALLLSIAAFEFVGIRATYED